jgi:hypothetical protein
MEVYPFWQGKWYPESYFLAGNMHYMEKRRFAIMKNDALVAKEGDTKFTFHDAEKFATELTKHLGIDTKKNSNL